ITGNGADNSVLIHPPYTVRKAIRYVEVPCFVVGTEARECQRSVGGWSAISNRPADNGEDFELGLDFSRAIGNQSKKYRYSQKHFRKTLHGFSPYARSELCSIHKRGYHALKMGPAIHGWLPCGQVQVGLLSRPLLCG